MIGIEASYPFSYEVLVRFLSKISGRSNKVNDGTGMAFFVYIYIYTFLQIMYHEVVSCVSSCMHLIVPVPPVLIVASHSCILMHALNPYCFLFRFSLSSEGEEVGTPHTISHYFLSDSSLGSY